MDLVEFEAKTLLRDAGLPVPAGRVLHADDPVDIDAAVVVKAQVPFGGRGKRGLVLPATADDAGAVVGVIRERMAAAGYEPPVLLLEESVDSIGEYYLAWRLDDVMQDFVLAFSCNGGVEIESNAESIAEMHVSPLQVPGAQDFVEFFGRQGLAGRTLVAVSRFAAGAWRVFTQADAQLLEVNPLAVIQGGDVIALDAKVMLDDNSRARHLERDRLYSATLSAATLTDLESRAAAAGITLVELPGEVAVLSGGAGLGMALLDLLDDAGLPAANFVDISGGSSPTVSALHDSLVFELAARPDVKAILMYITATASSLGKHVRSLVAQLDRAPPPKPMVVGLLCGGAAERDMNFEEARAIFETRGYPCARDLREMVDALVELCERERT